MNHTATYSPEDDKLRLYPACRLNKDDYTRAKSVGFRWAPKQELFFCVWSPAAEDLLLEWCDEIGDEDKSLVERAEERADRFEDYSDKRMSEAESARKAVSAIADNIPFGQPILVGHHSERHARRDAQKIENGMRKAVQMWKTSQYWSERAAGALSHAKYLERPDVRARRIKGLESDIRVYRSKFTPTTHENPANKAEYTSVAFQQRWNAERDAPVLLHVFCAPRGGKGGMWTPVEDLPGIEKHYTRWIEHAENRLVYERAMLDEQGATALLDKKPKSWQAQLPLCNYRAPEGIEIENNWGGGLERYPQREMTQAEYAKIYQDYKGTRVVEYSHRVRTAILRGAHFCVFLTDSKVHAKPAPGTKPERKPRTPVPTPELSPARQPEPENEAFSKIEESLKAGIQVVSANQLFPTPKDLAKRMCEAAEFRVGDMVLEPSAGTGAIIEQLTEWGIRIYGVELNATLVNRLRERFPTLDFRLSDFLFIEPADVYDRILMNPPFENGADIKHILHALEFLKPGGRLVAICANGPRQNEKLKPLADTWEELPAGTFEGTGVRAVLLTIDRAEAIEIEEERVNSQPRNCEQCGQELSGAYQEAHHIHWHQKQDAGKEVIRETKPQQGPALAENEEERTRMMYAGRSLPSLREPKTFDTERLADMPLFKSQGRLFT